MTTTTSATDYVLDLGALLAPIPGEDPAGRDVRYLPPFDAVKAARREAELAAASQDAGEMTAWAATADRGAEVLRDQSKDLQVALWTLESLSQLEGFRGAATGLALVRGLIDAYWDTLHPRIEPDDSEPLAFRASLMAWIDDKLPAILKSVPLTGSPAAYTLLHYDATLADAERKRALLEDGWPTATQLDDAFKATPLRVLEETLHAIVACRDEAAALERETDVRFVERHATASGAERVVHLVSFAKLRESLETARWLVDRAAGPKRSDGRGTPVAASPGSGGPSASRSAGSVIANAAAAVSAAMGAAVGAAVGRSQAADIDDAAQARELVRGNQLDGLRLLQARVAEAKSGRERFLRQLQFAEICLEAGIHALAYPIFDELGRTIDTRKLDEWEHQDVLMRAWRGLSACCVELKPINPDLDSRRQHADARLKSLLGEE